MNKVTSTAPERIWLQVSDDADDCDLPFTYTYSDEVTWCEDSVTACQVEYVRADITEAENAALRRENESLRAQCGLRQIQGYHEGKQRAEADNAALRRLLLRWLQIINRAKREAATVAEWDKLRQETDAALAGKEKP